ncbi:MAG: Trm112 family protein [Gemmatimonadaceae bacterium]|jgi:hypothetical protein|nr:Trm112 family protein [Gemmatimonadaceae bacterium]
MPFPADLLDILVCPKSKAPLEYHAGPPEVLLCRTSQLVYPIRDGIPILLIDEATPLDATQYPAPAGTQG